MGHHKRELSGENEHAKAETPKRIIVKLPPKVVTKGEAYKERQEKRANREYWRIISGVDTGGF